MKHKISKNTINDFFKIILFDDEWIEIWNVKDIFQKIESILYDILNDIWKSKIIQKSEIYDEKSLIKYIIHYHNVMQVMQFLIKYKSFEHDLTYSSVKHHTEKD